jgi:hypothetical protein
MPYRSGKLSSMTEVSAGIRLRPTRVGFLVRPTDLASVREIMSCCSCLWGGIYNPLIPVFRKPPKEWQPEPYDRVRGFAIAKGYVNFFEPDVYVESEPGLLEDAGLAALRERTIHPYVLPLRQFLRPLDREWGEPAFGLGIQDVLRHLYRTRQQFQLRDKRESIVVKPDHSSGVAEAVFGVYPADPHAAYIPRGYRDVFEPIELAASPEAWLKVFKEGAGTPLDVTCHGLDPQRYWHHELLIYVFDPRRATDLIDLWNLRLEPRPVVPIPFSWFEPLGDFIFELLKAEYRPIRGSPQQLMHNATIEFGRSIAKEHAERIIKTLKPGLPQEALAIKLWRNPIWSEDRDDNIHRDGRMKVTADEQDVKIVLNENKEITTSFEALAPEFARRYGGRDHRWVNAIRISAYGPQRIATVLPFNTFDPSWPHLGMRGDSIFVGTEGWIFPQRYKRSSEHVTLLTPEEAIVGSLKRNGIEARTSDPGHIARQMLEQLGGLSGTHLLADLDTLQLLNKMAGGVRKKANETEAIEENFGLRTAPLKDWIDLISRRKQRQPLPQVDLAALTTRNVIRLGLETDCPHCHAENWNTLTSVDYRITCDRCLKQYDFPQSSLRERNRNWSYRVVGPFSVPDYARGSYGALLALRVIDRSDSSMGRMTFTTAMTLKFDGIDAEVDFLAWRRDEDIDSDKPPEFIIGEAKSGGKGQLIKPRDLTKLKAVAHKLPDSIVVISVLRDHFLRSEKNLLKKFVTWGRRLNEYGQPTNPMVLLTQHELLMEHHLSDTWEKLGDPHQKYSGRESTRNLRNLADATQRIYLGMPSFYEWRESQLRKRALRKKSARSLSETPNV